VKTQRANPLKRRKKLVELRDGRVPVRNVFIYYLDPASIRTHIAQPLVPYSDMKNLGNHNKDSTQFFIRSTQQ
jgi:hypothetical protein